MAKKKPKAKSVGPQDPSQSGKVPKPVKTSASAKPAPPPKSRKSGKSPGPDASVPAPKPPEAGGKTKRGKPAKPKKRTKVPKTAKEMAAERQRQAHWKVCDATHRRFLAAPGIYGGRTARLVRLRFHGLDATYIPTRSWHQSEQIFPPGPDGSVDLTMELVLTRDLESFILEWDQCEVMDPQVLRGRIYDIAQRMMAIHSGEGRPD